MLLFYVYSMINFDTGNYSMNSWIIVLDELPTLYMFLRLPLLEEKMVHPIWVDRLIKFHTILRLAFHICNLFAGSKIHFSIPSSGD